LRVSPQNRSQTQQETAGSIDWMKRKYRVPHQLSVEAPQESNSTQAKSDS